MLKELFRAKNYVLLVFPSTHHALEAESLLQGKVEFVTIPTPRDISASCGLSLKISLQARPAAQELLKANQAMDYNIYLIDQEQQPKVITKLSD